MVEGWEPIAVACQTLLLEFDYRSEGLARVIAGTLDDYRTTPLDEIMKSLSLIGGRALVGLAERRGPSEEELGLASEWGRHRARGGHALDSVLRAFRLGFREWLTQLFPLVPARHHELMLDAITIMWSWLDEMSRTVERGYAVESSTLFAQTAHAREAFIAALREGTVGTDEVRGLCEVLGFDPTGSFQVMWARTPMDVDVFGSLLSDLEGVARGIIHGLDVIVVAQRVDVDRLENLLPDTKGPVGLGLERIGLEGAHASFVDAKLCLGLSEAIGGSLVRFDQDWLRAILYAERDRLAPLLERGVEIQGRSPHIADAALVFTSAGFSQSETARRLHLQPNSLNYRLRRWEELTERSLRTPEGVAYTVLAALSGERRVG
jgi:hypothetical protein